MAKNLQHVFFVDDEPAVRSAASKTLARLGCRVSCFEDAQKCLDELKAHNCDLLITDVKMPGMNGIDLVINARKIIPWLPVLVITGFGDIPMAVRAVKAGAADFIEKPLQWKNFLAAAEAALKKANPENLLKGKQLTKTEMIVLRFILHGKSNKEIANIQHRSIRTIEDHRRNIMRKFDVDNPVDLVKQAAAMGFVVFDNG